jgi:hypothetical protein
LPVGTGTAITIACFLAGWGLWALGAFVHYGHVQRVPDDDRLLTSVMPRYEVADRQQRLVDAPHATTYGEAQHFDLQQSPIVSAVFTARELILRSSHNGGAMREPFVQEVLTLGWRVVAEREGRELVFGSVTQPWRSDVRFQGLEPQTFTAFKDSGYAKIAWTIAVDSIGPSCSRVRTETRVATTDADSRARFRRYWAFLSPGILLIRYEALRTIASAAEAKAQPRGQCAHH